MSNRPAIPAEIERKILVESGHRCAVCGTPCPIERAHIIPWHKSREHKAEDLICLCANCHELADNDKWGEKTLREYKQWPWILRHYESVPTRSDSETSYNGPGFDVGEYPGFCWNLDGRDLQCIDIVQRQDVVELIKNVLQDLEGRRIVFLYGEPLVGKTFVLEQLRDGLQDQYIPVLIHVNGWASTRKQSEFLKELAESIRIDVESSMGEFAVEPFGQVSDLQATTEFSRFMHDLSGGIQAEEKPFLLMFDELEYLAREETDRRVFEYLAGLVEAYARRARFVFAGSGSMLELLKGGELTTLLARGYPVHVDCFDRAVSRDWVVALAAPYFAFEPRALEKIIGLADGHPCLLKEVVAIVARCWRDEWRKEVVDANDLNDIIDDLCLELCLKLTAIWYKLPEPEKRVLQQIALHHKKNFTTQELDIEDGYEVDIEDSREVAKEGGRDMHNCLEQLVKRRILDYDPQDKEYCVRLGLLIESISRGVLSMSG